MFTRRSYRIYRKRGKVLNEKILDACVDRDAMGGAAGLLGIVHGDTLVFDSEEEMFALMDFVLYDYLVDGRNAIQRYCDEIGPKDAREREILEAMLRAYSSLFRVATTSPRQSILVLTDLLEEREDIPLTDISFSRTTVPGVLLFTRVLPFRDFNMTSGSAFAFEGEQERQLRTRYQRRRKRIHADSESIARFIAFFELHKTHGIKVMYR